MRHTKIIATIGPASSRPESIEALLDAGVDVFRLNFSHGTHDDHAAAVERVRRAARGRLIGIMQDLSGPKIRTGRLEAGEPILLTEGDELRITTGDFVGARGRVSTTYEELGRAVKPGDRLLLDDGHIELRVQRTDGREIVTAVVDGGPLGEHKGINAPGVRLPASALTAKDLHDLEFGLQIGVDLIAVSFVQTAADVRRAREAVAAAGGRPRPIIAKIERPEAVANIEEILDASDAMMVARGDLGLEMPLERVPRVQKEITHRARVHGVPVIVATQVLDSMRMEPRPTRAEVSDAASAVADGVDAIMLTGETAVGRYPVKTVQVLNTIIREAESVESIASSQSLALPPAGAERARALCEAAMTLARSAQADAIVAVTKAGHTARLLSSLRPRVQILAVTPDESVGRALALLWGVVPLHAPESADLERSREDVTAYLLRRGVVGAGSLVVFVNASADLTAESGNFVRLQRLGP